MKNVDDGAFDSCTSLEFIAIRSVKKIGNYAFANCSSLQSVDIPECETIADMAFSHCSALSSLSAVGVRKLGKQAFIKCTNILSIDMPLCESVGDGAFKYCSSMKSLCICSVQLASQSIDVKVGVNCISRCKNLIKIDSKLSYEKFVCTEYNCAVKQRCPVCIKTIQKCLGDGMLSGAKLKQVS